MPVIAGAASAGLQAGVGIWQMYQGNKIRKNTVRPKYEIPEAVKSKMTTAEMLQFQGLPEDSKQEYVDNLTRNQAFSFGQLDDRKAGLAGTAAINQQGMDAAKNLLSMDAQQRIANTENLQNVRSEYGDFQEKQFTFDKANPFYEKMNEANALSGAGMQNFMTGANTAGTSAANADYSGMGGSNKSSKKQGLAWMEGQTEGEMKAMGL